MAVRKILLYPEHKSALRKASERVAAISPRIHYLVRDLKDTLASHPEGIGLAAPQIDAHLRVVIVRLGAGQERESKPRAPITLINPEILIEKVPRLDFDGCLSFPGLYADTVRPHYLRVAGIDEKGEPFNQVFEGFDAVIVHHEIDHLDGILFVDRVEKVGDLYRVKEDENGQLVRVPVDISV